MNIDEPLALLGGLSPAQFMRRHWHKKPLLVRQALPGLEAPLARQALFELAQRDDVESRLVMRTEQGWQLRHGPLKRRALPPLRQRAWTLLVQGVDLHVASAHELLTRFRFVPAARLDDLMVSWASDGGGVGPHVDAYDVFLVQAMGRRHWRVGPVRDASCVPEGPLRILRRFTPTEEWVLEPGDLLYLPPGWGHDGIADGACMTCSVGFRAPSRAELCEDLLSRLGLEGNSAFGRVRYRDPAQVATQHPGRVPPALVGFARDTLLGLLAQDQALELALGEALTEPKPRVWFVPGRGLRAGAGVRLDARSRMVYDDRHVFLNGEAFAASGRDARLMRRLADDRRLDALALRQLTPAARALLGQWARTGWLHGA